MEPTRAGSEALCRASRADPESHHIVGISISRSSNASICSPLFSIAQRAALVITATLQRGAGSSATRVYGMNRPRWPGGERMALGVPWRVMAACVLLLTALATWGPPSAQTSRPLVYVVPIDGVIDLGLAPLLARTIRDAEQAVAAAVVLDINTFGGRVDAAVVMRDALFQARIRTIAFVNDSGDIAFPSSGRPRVVVQRVRPV